MNVSLCYEGLCVNRVCVKEVSLYNVITVGVLYTEYNIKCKVRGWFKPFPLHTVHCLSKHAKRVECTQGHPFTA